MSIAAMPDSVSASPTVVSASELKDRMARGERFQLIDVRSLQEYSEGHIPGAVNLPLEQVEARLADMHSQDPVVLVCQSGRRAGMACNLLQTHRNDLQVLTGGTKAWMDDGYSVVRTASTRLPLMRQVQIGAGSMILLGTTLSLLVHPAWITLAMFAGTGLLVAGTTGFCGMALLLEKAPWNR